MNIEQIIRDAANSRASDIHVANNSYIKFRIDGKLENYGDHILTPEDCVSIAKQIAEEKFEKVKETGEIDLARTIADRRLRINIFHSNDSISSSMRILNNKIPELDSLGLPAAVKTFSSFNKGIVLVTGETGSGKSTTLAAILDQINHTQKLHIVTLEDPIEYIYKPDLCLINQREVGQDTRDYAQGLRAILREDPNVILIGEMRDQETIETALTAAETGHLVFATLHTNSAADSVDRIISVFPAEKHEQIRTQLASCIQAILSQQLLVRYEGKGRIAACECMIATSAIRNQIREANTNQIPSSILSATNLGCITMDNCLINMIKERKITPEVGLRAANDQDKIKQQLGLRTGMGMNIGGNKHGNI